MNFDLGLRGGEHSLGPRREAGDDSSLRGGKRGKGKGGREGEEKGEKGGRKRERGREEEEEGEKGEEKKRRREKNLNHTNRFQCFFPSFHDFIAQPSLLVEAVHSQQALYSTCRTLNEVLGIIPTTPRERSERGKARGKWKWIEFWIVRKSSKWKVVVTDEH